MSQREFLVRLVERFEAARIPFMIVGSLGSTYHGEPRATNDINIVIDPSLEQLDSFLASLGNDYYVSGQSMREAWSARSMFNVIDFDTGWKADLIIRKDRAYSVEEFRRRAAARLLDIDLFVVSPEDAILSKLEWGKMGQSERQARDALGVAIVQLEKLDLDYLRTWARELGVREQLDSVLRQAERVKR